MLKWLVDVVLGKVLSALMAGINQAISEKRRDDALVQVGAISVSKDSLNKALDDVLQSAEIRQRIRNDPAYRERVRAAARGDAG